jgi:septal ring factor EnvC (AmiA/AmiB activator)
MHMADCEERQAREWQRNEEAAADARALAERARAEAGRLRRALADAEIDLQRRAAASAAEQRNAQARALPRSTSVPRRARVASMAAGASRRGRSP